jgi:molybdopterin converting factor small subunit
MQIKLRLFAAFKDLIGKSELDLNFKEGDTLEDLKNYLTTHYPQINHLLRISKFAVNMEYQDCNPVLNNNDEVTIIMPVSGGLK